MGCVARIVLAGLLAAVSTQASAQSRQEGNYEMVVTQDYQNASFGVTSGGNGVNGLHRRLDKVVILDKRSGELWAWSDKEQTVMYLGYIFPLVGKGVFARIIEVPDQKTR
jgi:hypothetical protein